VQRDGGEAVGIDVERLAASPLFEGVSAEELAHIAQEMEERHAEPGERLTIEGSSGYFFFLIEDGTAEVSHDGEVVARLGPGDFFGEAAILESRRRTATVTASTPMTMAVMFGAEFAKLTQDDPAVGDKIHAAIKDRRPVN
jgi:CRP/FNR family cyclic AMP-dependent transcriptional regulator